MTSEERDDIELAGHAIWACLRNENHGTEADRIRVITRRFWSVADRRNRPRHQRPKLLRASTTLGGFGR